MDPHYLGIIAGYGAASAAAWALCFAPGRVLVAGPAPSFGRPWVELGLLALAVVAVLGVGQLYVRDLLLPDEGIAFQSLNQIAIFAPVLIVLVWRGQPLRSAYLDLKAAPVGLPAGVVLAVLAYTVYAASRGWAGNLPTLAAETLRAEHIPFAVQILLEDIVIAAALARLTAATNPPAAIGVVAALFAVAHIPAMLAGGATPEALSSLVIDAAIGVLVLGAVLATRSIWWFWPGHVALDLTQFLSPPG